MPLTPKGSKIKAAMTKEYGPKRGEEVFYASKNAGRIKGVDQVRKALAAGKREDAAERAAIKAGQEEKEAQRKALAAMQGKPISAKDLMKRRPR